MKRFAITCSAFFFLSFHVTAQTYLNCDFSNGIPADFILIDNDGNTPSADMQELGFTSNTPWISITPTGESDKLVAATSWYDPAGTSSDWFITPAMSINDDNVVLSWRCRSRNKRTHNAYSVYVSLNGGTSVSDFDTTTPLFTSSDVPNTWTKQTVSLEAYKGKTIRLAFVENSTDKDVLYLDDILVSVHSDISIKSRLNDKVHTVGETTVSADVTNNGETDIFGFDVSLIADGETTTQHFSDIIPIGSSVGITLDRTLSLGKHETKPYQLEVSDGVNYFVENDTVTSYQRKTFIEEVTGTWCLWCVRGIVALQNLRTTQSDKFIGLAVHHNDVMTTDYYDLLDARFDCDNLPTGVINRKGGGIDPLNFAQEVENSVGEKAVYSDISLTASIDSESTVNSTSYSLHSTTDIIFGNDESNANYKLAYIISENNVHHPGNKKYGQQNAYTGGEYGEMGGWEQLPSLIDCENMWFNDVARYYDGDFFGIEGLVPSVITAGKTVSVNHDFNVPADSVDDINNCELIVLLIDGNNNQIVNAQNVKLNPEAEEPTDVAARYITLGIDLPLKGTEGSHNLPLKGVGGSFSLSGIRLSQPQKGINIIGNRKIIIK